MLAGATAVHLGELAGALALLVQLRGALDVLGGLLGVLLGKLLMLSGDLPLALALALQR